MKYKSLIGSLLVVGLVAELLILQFMPGPPLHGSGPLGAYGVVYLIIIGGPIGAMFVATIGQMGFLALVSAVFGLGGIATVVMNRGRDEVIDFFASVLWCSAGGIGLLVAIIYAI